MQQVGAWHITASGPVRLPLSSVRMEEDLECWIESHPDLLQNGLTIVARQLDLPGCGRLDLLALDQNGQWVVIEVKRGTLDRETVAQAVDYASAIASLQYRDLVAAVEHKTPGLDVPLLLEERQAQELADSCMRDVRIVVVGTGQAPGLQRMIGFLADKGALAIETVFYQVFRLADGDRVLVREVVEEQQIGLGDQKYQPSTLQAMRDWARQMGIGEEFESIISAGERHGLYLHPWKHSLMLAPQSNKSRCLITVWATPVDGGRVSLYVAARAFAEFFSITEDESRAILEYDQWQKLDVQGVERLVANLDRLFDHVARATNDDA